MHIFLHYGIPIIILAVAIIVAYFIPTYQPIQIIIAALLGGVPMWLLNNLLHRPNVVIEGLGQEVDYELWRGILMCSTNGIIISKSPTGIGALKSLVLRIFVSDEVQLDIPLSEPNIVGHKFEGCERLPANRLKFTHLDIPIEANQIVGKPAEIRLSVIGQGLKRYRTKMKE